MLYKEIKKVWTYLAVRRKRHLKLLVVFMIFTAFFEILSISAVLPFLAAITDPSIVLEYEIVKNILNIFNIKTESDFLFIFTISFCIAAILAAVMRLILLYFSSKLSYMIGAEIGIEIYNKTLYQPYQIHAKRNSSDVISVISVKVQMIIVNVLAAILTMITSLILAMTIISFLILMNPIIALSVIIFFGALYSLLTYLTRKEINRGGQIIADESTKIVKTLQEGLGGIRDIILDGTQDFYIDIYSKSEISLRKAQIKNQVVRESPRFVMEGIAMVGIATLAYLITGDDGVSKALPLLGAVAIGSQRLLPLIQNGYNAIIKLRGSLAAIQDIGKFLNQERQDHLMDTTNKDKLEFASHIELKDVSFSYLNNGPKIFDNLNIKVSKGSRIGFVGKTGSGKSTLIDIIMGLLSPTNGNMIVDNTEINKTNMKLWQNNIAHVPQHIYLSDESIINNIAFGLSQEDIDFERVKKVAEQARISDTIKDMPEKYNTKIGERGIRLSGGQRQRIGIARALYKGADLIVLDEATSALDSNTEKEIMEIFDNLGRNITLLIIAHRISTLNNCHKIYEVEDGLIREVKFSSLEKRS